MTGAEMLEEVKIGLGIATTYQDKEQDRNLLQKINATVAFLVDAGIPEEEATDIKKVGFITQGVSDLMGAGDFSQLFKTLIIQQASGHRRNADV